jgi:hypothetical protein
MDTKNTEARQFARRKDDQHPLAPLNWDETPTLDEMKATDEALEAMRQRVQQGTRAMLEQYIKTMGVDPMRVVMLQRFDLDGSIHMTVKTLPEPDMRPHLARLQGQLVEIGNLGEDPDIDFSLDMGDGRLMTMVGMAREQARAIAQYYGEQIEITVRAAPAGIGKNG